jgi:CubicO group peptidase (beta-lactamase class C family)
LGAAVVSPGAILALDVVGVREAGGDVAATRDDLWHVGSLTKSVTSTLALKLVQQGLIRFDSTVGELLGPHYSHMQAAYRNVKLSQLLGHRAGTNGDPLQLPVWNSLRDPVFTTAEHRRRFVADTLAWPPENVPGSAYLYSNAGYVLAGAMLEMVTGRPWEELVDTHILQPLKLTSTGFGPPGSAGMVDNLRGHILRGGRYEAVTPSVDADNPAALGPAGTMHMSLLDLAHYIQAHLSAGSFLSADDLALLHAPLAGQDYGQGWKVVARDWAEGMVLTHTGSNTTWFAVVWIAPSNERAYIAVTNVGAPSGNLVTEAAISRMLARSW